MIVESLGDAIGQFPDANWSTWNWKLKNAFRRFVRGDRGIVGEVATRIAGSFDLFSQQGQSPISGISYVACHDGMTLQDLVSYNSKHNQRNGEDSGDDDNMSWNCGVEGPTRDPIIEDLRRRQAKNFLAMLLLSQGVPMILAGDECGRTQQGNNNPWDQDNPLTWFDWSIQRLDQDRLRFTRP
jgi:isoamylase